MTKKLSLLLCMILSITGSYSFNKSLHVPSCHGGITTLTIEGWEGIENVEDAQLQLPEALPTENVADNPLPLRSPQTVETRTTANRASVRPQSKQTTTAKPTPTTLPSQPAATNPVNAPTGKFGELLDWWTQAQYVWPIGKTARIVDLISGKSFMVKRSYGAFHADVEPLTAADTQMMKSIWGQWSWAVRPVIIEVNGRRLAAAANGMPHSIQTITTNNFDGHFCVHFKNSTRHKDNLVDQEMQRNINKAAGL